MKNDPASPPDEEATSVRLLRPEAFEQATAAGTPSLHTLRNARGTVAQFSSYGARWLSMWVPDQHGIPGDVVLGFDTLAGYLRAKERYHGAVIGRVCGRLGGGGFHLDGRDYPLEGNDLFGHPRPNHLHGGSGGFSFRCWEAAPGPPVQDGAALVMRYVSPDGEEGYPGRLVLTLTYTLEADDTLRLDYEAVTDRPTLVNPTSHAFFQLGADPGRKILDHLLQIDAAAVLDCDDQLLPTGRQRPVRGTPLDFSRPRAVGERLHHSVEGLLIAGRGYAATYLLNPDRGGAPAARLEDPVSGRVLELFTDRPCLQLYTGWMMDGSEAGKGGRPHGESCGLALEAQDYPDAPRHPSFPSIALRPGDVYRQRTAYRFRAGRPGTQTGHRARAPRP